MIALEFALPAIARASWFTPVLWTVQGYAVFDNPSLPIVGEGEKEPNDTYVQQLTANAEAAVNKLVESLQGKFGHHAVLLLPTKPNPPGTVFDTFACR